MTHRVNHDMKVIEIFFFSYLIKTFMEGHYISTIET